ncbi:MAG: hypothetical protein ACOYN3_01320 [Acidimicrobiia bacterium]
MTRLGMLGTRSAVDIDDHGRCVVAGSSAAFEVWVGAEDGWHDPAAQASTRQERPGIAPAIETRVRVAGGDVHTVVFGAYTHPDIFVVEVTNRSSAACAIAIVAEQLAASVAPDGVDSDGPDLLLPRAPRDVVYEASRAELWNTLHQATSPLVEGVAVGTPRAFAAKGHCALVYPLPHAAMLRFAVCCTEGTREPIALDALPSLDAVEAGWRAQLQRGMRVELADQRLQHAIDAARVSLLIEHATERATPDMMMALEDWGFDTEAEDAFDQLGFRDRRRVATRANDAAPWSHLEAILRTMGPTLECPDGPAHFLRHVRHLVAQERPDGTVDVVTHLPPTWAGQALTITDIPTRVGRLSVAIRWHGNRPAVLWEADKPGVRLHLPGLDPVWMSDEQSGEALLAPVGV